MAAPDEASAMALAALTAADNDEDTAALVRRALQKGSAGEALLARVLAAHAGAARDLADGMAKMDLDRVGAAAGGEDVQQAPLPPEPTLLQVAGATEECVLTYLAAAGERAVKQGEEELREMQQWDDERREAEFGSLEKAVQQQAMCRRQLADLTALVSLVAARCWERAYGRYARLGEERARLPFALCAVVGAKGAGLGIRGQDPRSPEDRIMRQKVNLRELVREALVVERDQQG